MTQHTWIDAAGGYPDPTNPTALYDAINTLQAAVQQVNPAFAPTMWAPPTTGTPLSASWLNDLEQRASGAAAQYVTLDSLYTSADQGDYGVTLNRVLPAAVTAGQSIVLTRMYPVATTVNIPSGATVVGNGPATGLQTPVNAPVVAILGTNVSGVTLQNFTVDGNCAATTSKSYVRSIQFIGSSKLRLHQITTKYNPDWACSFEVCTDVYVTDYVHLNGTTGSAEAFSGRDGIHFMDCTDVLLDGAKVHSQDDCVGITSKTQNIAHITIRNVTGVSEVAAVVTVGNESTTSYNAADITIENISTYTSPSYAGFSSYVVKCLAQNSAYVRGLRISNVTGTASQYGIWVAGNGTADSMADVVISNAKVTSTTRHGVYLSNVSHFLVSAVRALSAAGAYDGFNISTSKFGTLTACGARGCSLWGLQLNACTSIDVASFMARDCGGNNFSASTGGNGRIVNSSDVQVLAGQFVGSASTSYYGLSQSGNTAVTISAQTRVQGAN